MAMKRLNCKIEGSVIKDFIKELDAKLDFPPYKPAKIVKDTKKFLFPKGFSHSHIFNAFVKAKATNIKIYQNQDLEGKLVFPDVGAMFWIMELTVRDDFEQDQDKIISEMKDIINGLINKCEIIDELTL